MNRCLNKIKQKLTRLLFSYKVRNDHIRVRVGFVRVSVPYQPVPNQPLCFDHRVYGKAYLPYYNTDVAFTNHTPRVYNREGNPMDLFFLRDMHGAHTPYGPEMASKYFLWDRFNFGLPTHFYTHNAMLETMGKPTHRYGLLMESPAIVPDDYTIFQRHKGLHKDFDLIFTYCDKILNTIPNAKFLPFFAAPWYGSETYGGTISPQGYLHKTKNISIVSSDKTMCPLHHTRIALAKKCKREHLADTYGTFDGGPRVKNAVSLTDYRYSIVVENDLSPFFFTQKITSCFAAHTIPIYLGTSQIGRFFNQDGIIPIQAQDVDNLPAILQRCNEQDYLSRLDAVKDNFERVKKYFCIFDWLYETYLPHHKERL